MLTPFVLLKALSLWVAILLLAIINGVLRENLLIPELGRVAGLLTSGLVLSGCIFLVALLAAHWYGPLSPSRYWAIGGLWLLLTLGFEFSFGRLVQHKEWADLLEAYTFRNGNIWPIVLVFVLISPWLTARLRRLV
jgi:hypothetical protein